MKTLDLHGIQHAEVESQVIDFAYKTEAPFKIVTGNSRRMKDLVIQVLTRFELHAYEESDHNLGALIVVERRGKLPKTTIH